PGTARPSTRLQRRLPHSVPSVPNPPGNVRRATGRQQGAASLLPGKRRKTPIPELSLPLWPLRPHYQSSHFNSRFSHSPALFFPGRIPCHSLLTFPIGVAPVNFCQVWGIG